MITEEAATGPWDRSSPQTAPITSGPDETYADYVNPPSGKAIDAASPTAFTSRLTAAVWSSHRSWQRSTNSGGLSSRRDRRGAARNVDRWIVIGFGQCRRNTETPSAGETTAKSDASGGSDASGESSAEADTTTNESQSSGG